MHIFLKSIQSMLKDALAMTHKKRDHTLACGNCLVVKISQENKTIIATSQWVGLNFNNNPVILYNL